MSGVCYGKKTGERGFLSGENGETPPYRNRSSQIVRRMVSSTRHEL